MLQLLTTQLACSTYYDCFALEGDVFIGQKAATELRGLLKINYPLEHGIVTDWDDMERIWEYVYGEGLKTLSEEVWFGDGDVLRVNRVMC